MPEQILNPIKLGQIEFYRETIKDIEPFKIKGIERLKECETLLKSIDITPTLNGNRLDFKLLGNDYTSYLIVEFYIDQSTHSNEYFRQLPNVQKGYIVTEEIIQMDKVNEKRDLISKFWFDKIGNVEFNESFSKLYLGAILKGILEVNRIVLC